MNSKTQISMRWQVEPEQAHTGRRVVFSLDCCR